jgi:hypothetical protein
MSAAKKKRKRASIRAQRRALVRMARLVHAKLHGPGCVCGGPSAECDHDIDRTCPLCFRSEVESDVVIYL